ncbi:MAG: hypothetical protein J2P38_07665 [Candidatus Dormibacteraeota bacterium]|nr:hypothetical protein [Candidatus Dormibacteraeota bacterium]
MPPFGWKRLPKRAPAPAPPSGSDLVDLIRPRLWGAETLKSVTVPVLSRPVAPDLEAVLSVDLPSAVVSLSPEDALATGRSIAELWDAAYRQTDDGLPVRRESTEGLQALYGDSMFVASRLLDLEHLTGPLPPRGALVAVPNRHTLLLHPIETLGAVGTLKQIVLVAHGIHERGPGSIVPHVYWWRRGQPLLMIPATVDQAVTVMPPDEFVEMLNELPG